MRLLTLDQAPTNIGWCWGDTDTGPIAMGCQTFESYGQNDRLLQRAVRTWFARICNECLPEVVAYEQIVLNVHRPNIITWHQQFAVVAAVDCVCDIQDIDTYSVEIGKWRKHFIGTAGAPRSIKTQSERAAWFKDKAIERCKQLGWQIPNHHAAEACGIWDYAAWKLDAAYKSASRKAENVRQAA